MDGYCTSERVQIASYGVGDDNSDSPSIVEQS